MGIESERTYARNEIGDTQDNSDDPYLSKYDFEIKLANWKRLLIIILYYLTLGLRTLIESFLNEKAKKKTNLFSNCIIFF